MTLRVAVPVLPAASRAVIVRTFVPLCRTIPLAVQLVVPVAVPLPPRLFAHVTWVTPMLSDAVPATVSGLVFVVKVGPEVGVVMLTVGAVVSMLQVKLAGVGSVFPAGSVARTWKVWLPAASAL